MYKLVCIQHICRAQPSIAGEQRIIMYACARLPREMKMNLHRHTFHKNAAIIGVLGDLRPIGKHPKPSPNLHAQEEKTMNKAYSFTTDAHSLQADAYSLESGTTFGKVVPLSRKSYHFSAVKHSLRSNHLADANI